MNPNSGNSEAPQLPTLVRGQQIRNGPFLITVTDSMASQRDKENRELLRRWQEAQRLRNMIENQDEYLGEFNEMKVRRRFIRRVFSILTLQLLFTALVIATFIFVDQAREIMLKYPYLWMISLGVFTITFVSISCCDCARRQIPCNIICLILMTVSLAYLTAAVSVFYTNETVLMTASATALVTLIICSIAACTKFDLTKRTGLLLIVGLVATIGLLILSVALYFTQIRLLQVIIAIIGTLLISMYLFFDLQTIMGGRSIELSPDEVVYATTQLYVDIIMLYRYLLILGGLTE